jgi:hypothetical protein
MPRPGRVAASIDSAFESPYLIEPRVTPEMTQRWEKM